MSDLAAGDTTVRSTPYGLCDLGMGFAEFGSVWLPEIIALRGQLGLPVERDLSFTAQGRIAAYIEASQAEGRIIEQLPVMA